MRDAGYYLREDNLIEPKFEGKAARIIGQEWSREAFLNLYEGYTTDELGNRDKKLPRYMHPDRRGAFDITFNLPKSVSIVKELGSDPRIGDVMTAAREAAMKEIERQADVRCPWLKPGNLVWSAFRHPASRTGDPHVHDHVVVFNLSHEPIKRSWKAIELRYLDRKGISEIYRDTCIKGLNELGYKTKRVGQEYEIVGVPAEVKAIFSSRHEAIDQKQQAMEAKIGKPMSSKAKQKLSVYDRPEKDVNLPLPERHKSWVAQMTEVQWKTVQGVVRNARMAVKAGKDSFVHWQQGIARYASQLRNNVLFQEAEAPERSRENGRSR